MSVSVRYIELVLLVLFMSIGVHYMILYMEKDNSSHYSYIDDKSIIKLADAYEYIDGAVLPDSSIPIKLSKDQIWKLPACQDLAKTTKYPEYDVAVDVVTSSGTQPLYATPNPGMAGLIAMYEAPSDTSEYVLKFNKSTRHWEVIIQ